MRSHKILCAMFLVLGFWMSARARADVDPVAFPAVLVATQEGAREFGESVLLAIPLEDGSHFGFVLNAPTDMPVAALFPDEEATARVKSNVSAGGPVLTQALFAIVRDRTAASSGMRRISPELVVAIGSDDVDRVIAQQPADARFFIGMVRWSPGELAREVEAGAWRVRAATPSIVLTEAPGELWTRLSPRPGEWMASLR